MVSYVCSHASLLSLFAILARERKELVVMPTRLNFVSLMLPVESNPICNCHSELTARAQQKERSRIIGTCNTFFELIAETDRLMEHEMRTIRPIVLFHQSLDVNVGNLMGAEERSCSHGVLARVEVPCKASQEHTNHVPVYLRLRR